MKALFSIILSLLLSGLVKAQTTFTNPVIDSDFPDVDIIRVNNDYYLLSTTMFHFPGATILHSHDMVNWEFYAAPLKKLSDKDSYNLLNGKDEYHHGMWASGLKYHDGKFYLLLNAQGFGSFIMTATDLRGEWTMKKLDHTYYDSNFLFDNDGRIYIVYGNSHISVAEVDKDFNYIRSKEIITRPNTGLEGNHLYHIGDYYYVYSTYGGYPSGQAAFRSKDPFGQYEEKMLFEKQIGGKINTVHQGALVQTQTGEWWSMLFEDENASGRMPHLQPVTWLDGWPILGNNGVPCITYKVPSIGCAPYPKLTGVSATEASDDFNGEALSPQWQWNHQEAAGSWSLTERKGWLRMRTVGTAKVMKQARGTITERIPGFRNKKDKFATVKMDASKMKEGDIAGLSVFQDPYAYVGVEKTGKGYNIVWREDTVRNTTRLPENNITKVALKGKPSTIYLRTKVNFPKDEAEYFYSLDGENFMPIGGRHKMSFNLSVFVGARYYIFNFATKRKGGYVDVDYIHFTEK
ncbi:MAG: glycoside hydrolase 43 family protein [Prevotella sp.]|nr:glycoside hydrolase 43 family protein [Prevotella sp.]